MKKFIDNFFKYRYFLSLLIKKELKIKYRESILGIIWSLLNPLLISLVMYVVFGKLFNRGRDFLVYLTVGRIFYSFMSGGTNAAMASVISSGGITKKIYVPKYLFPLSKVTTIFIETMIAVAIIFVIMPIGGISYSWTNIFVFLPLVVLFFFTYGLGLILATINVFFRDIQHLYTVVLLAWMYSTPIFWPVDLAKGSLLIILKLNPLYYYITMARDSIMDGQLPSLEHFLIGVLFAVVMFVAGNLIFYKNKDKFILYL